MSPAKTKTSRWAEEALAQLENLGLRRTLEPLSSPQGSQVEIAGKQYLNFSSNDYLGLAREPLLAQAASECLRKAGTGTGASRLVVGDTVWHAALEEALAEFAGSEAALLFNSGYAANVGILSTLVSEGDVIFSDELNHASVIDGCRLSKAKTVVYPHRNLEALESLLKMHAGRRRLLVTDAVFSMDGDVAPLAELVKLSQRYETALMVDEAHAVGIFGKKGSGLCEALGLESQVDVRMGTLGKSLGSFGAYVVAAKPVCEWLLNRARSLVFSTALPASVCAASLRAIEWVKENPARKEKLWENIRMFSKGLNDLGISAVPQSAIFPWVLGTPEKAMHASRNLRDFGVLAKAIRPPTVPQGTSRIRFALSAAHSSTQIAHALSAIAQVKNSLSKG